jgi:DNA-binding CsgD family transcriptional regulator
MGVIEDLARAREAFERRAWVSAYDALSSAGDDLTAADFVRLAEAALLVGRRNDFVQAMQRGYQAHLRNGDRPAAARAAAGLAMELLMGGEFAIAQGWMTRCRRVLDEHGEDVAEVGYHLTLLLFQRLFGGSLDGLVELSAEIVEYGRRFDDPDLIANGLNAQGRMLIYAGRVREGLALLDEAMVAVSLGEVSPIYAGHVYCSLVEACQELSDYERAAEWTSALTRWIEAQPDLVLFTGQCAVHRGQIMKVRGAYDASLEEFANAVERYLAAGNPAPAGFATAEWADVLRIRGELDQAERTYERAVGFGHEAQPGLALLWVARGRVDAASIAVRRLLLEPRPAVHRSALLPGAVEVLLAAGDVDAAKTLAGELAAVADDFGGRALRARSRHASGSVLLSAGDAAGALPLLRDAVREWRALDAPYDAARSRELVGLALRALGDADSAGPELAAAAATFNELGAAPDARRLAALTRPLLPGGLTEREVEVLRLVATGRSNPEIAATLVLSEKTVARHLSNIFGKLEVTSRTAAAAYAFEHGLL